MTFLSTSALQIGSLFQAGVAVRIRGKRQSLNLQISIAFQPICQGLSGRFYLSFQWCKAIVFYCLIRGLFTASIRDIQLSSLSHLMRQQHQFISLEARVCQWLAGCWCQRLCIWCGTIREMETLIYANLFKPISVIKLKTNFVLLATAVIIRAPFK